jgi:DNA-3-methyladenine glycosylase
MFGPPGVAYVYLVYGMYDCLNVVTGPDQDASAVLIRAAEPLVGLERMRADRLAVAGRRRAAREGAGLERARAGVARIPDHRLASGPGNVAAAFGIDTSWTGTDLCAAESPLRLERDERQPADAVPDALVAVSPRVGVEYAGPEWSARRWRWSIAGHRSVSGPAAR